MAAYPEKPIRLVVPYSTGGSADAVARAVAGRLASRLGQPVIVDNRPGAGTAIGVSHVATAPADGYTLLYGGTSSQTMNPVLNRVSFDPVKDFAGVTLINTLPLVLVVKPELPVHSFADYLEYAKRSSTPLTYASAGAGTSNHLAGELLSRTAGITLTHVPYKGSAPALADVLGGHVDSMFDLVLTAAPQVRLERLRPLAITSAERSPLLPDVPTMKELGMPEGEVDVWSGLFAPTGTPPAIIDTLNQAMLDLLSKPDIQEVFAGFGAQVVSSTPAELTELVAVDLKKWRDLSVAAGLVPKD